MFLNRQTLYLRPDPARVVVRPFRPTPEPRDLKPTDKARANHIVGGVLGLDPAEQVGTGTCSRSSRGVPSRWRGHWSRMPF
jgi:hypothetical protein